MNRKKVHSKTEKSKERFFSDRLLVSLKDAGGMLGVSARTIRRLSQDGKLPAIVKVGHSTRISYQAVLDYVISLTGKLGGLTL
jgi:excisionase family DNA binding protein